MSNENELIRLRAYVAALEGLLCAVVANLPNRANVLADFVKSENAFDELAISGDFTDEELDAFKAARNKLLVQLNA